MGKRKHFTQQDLDDLETDLIEHLASGQPAPQGSEPFLERPSFVEKLEARKQELKNQNQQMAKHCLTSAGMASHSISAILQKVAPGVDQPALQAEIPKLMQQLKSGDGSMLEEMLLGQSLQLQTLASNLIAQGSLQNDLNAKQILLHLGLKASNQLRQTVSTLNELRNPRRTTFIRRQTNQLHLASENQKKLEKSSNELFGRNANDTQEMDTRAEGATVRTHPALEALGVEQRPSNR